MKSCNICGKVKPLSAFYRARYDAYVNECIECGLLNATGQQNMFPAINSDQALCDLKLLNERTIKLDFHEYILDGIQRKIPTEILTRMEELWDMTKRISGELIAIGKIIVFKIFDFLKVNPKLSAGLAVGMIIYFLSNAIPFIGPIIAPILATVAAIYTIYKISSLNEMQEIIKDFFKLLVDIFNLVAQRSAVS